jgi:hypothetical protein
MFHSETRKAPMLITMLSEPLLAGVVGGVYNHFSESDPSFQNWRASVMYGSILALANLASTQGTAYLMPDVFRSEKLKRVQHAGLNAGVTAGLNVWLQSVLQNPKDLRVSHNALTGAIAGGSASIGAPMIVKLI